MVTDFRKKLIDEMGTRGLKEQTKRAYISAMKSLCLFHNKKPDQLDLPEIKEYHRHLAVDKNNHQTQSTELCLQLDFFIKIF